jgi:universal stress protein A
MLKYKHILLAVDLSAETGFIAKKAFELAEQMGAKVSIVHVVEPLPGYGYAYIGAADVETQLIDEAKKQMATLGKKHDVIKSRQYTEFGPAGAEIVRIADEKKADLIVIGSHGRHGLGLLLGSTANAVIHRANCDVLTVRIKE